MAFRKYDVDIGLRPVDEKVEAEISKQETQVHVSGIHKIFWIFAGADKEVDWKALKLVLDYGMRNGSYSIKRNMLGVLQNYFFRIEKGFQRRYLS